MEIEIQQGGCRFDSRAFFFFFHDPAWVRLEAGHVGGEWQWACNKVVTCPGCDPAFTQRQLGLAPAPCDPERRRNGYRKRDGWLAWRDGCWRNPVRVFFFFLPQGCAKQQYYTIHTHVFFVGAQLYIFLYITMSLVFFFCFYGAVTFRQSKRGK